MTIAIKLAAGAAMLAAISGGAASAQEVNIGFSIRCGYLTTLLEPVMADIVFAGGATDVDKEDYRTLMIVQGASFYATDVLGANMTADEFDGHVNEAVAAIDAATSDEAAIREFYDMCVTSFHE